VATNEGVFVQFPGEQAFMHFTTDPENPDSISGEEVFSLYEDPQGVVWLGTIDGGLNRFDRSTRTFKSYSAQEGLPGNWIACIQADDQGNLWLGTNRGLSKFNPQMETFINYDNQDGLQAGEFYSCTKTANGELYFGGLQGINAFYPQDITNNLDLPPIVITSFNLFNQTEMEDLEDGEKLELNHQENFISFDYAALDFNAPQKNQYAYMLEGLDKDWVYVGSRRHAEYPDLNPGEYTFRVKAANNDGIWNEDGTSVHISIKPPVWQTAWFQALMVVLLAGTVFAGYQLRVRNLRARSQELEAEVEQRTNALNECTQEAEERQAEIKALYRADEELYRYLHLDHVLNALMETAIDILKADKGLLVVWDENHESLKINTSTGFQPETIDSLAFTPGEGNIGTVALHGEPIIVADAAADPKISQQLVKAEQIHTSILVPIKINTEIFGVFSVDYVQPHPVSDQELRLLAALAQRTALAIENARLYEQAQALAALEERNRLARDLHDSVTQSLFGASMFADTAEHQLAAGQIDQAAETISKLRDTTKGALGEMRLLIYELRPPVLENEGLPAALVSRLETVEQRAGLRTELDIEDIDRLSPDIEQQFYSIAIEALNNILKHAQAEKISVSLRKEGTQIELQVEDDGIGFDLAAERESVGLGLIGMEERAAQLGAQLNIESAPGNGACLQLIMEIEL
jgi:signal transduction histidine kinase